MAEVVADRAGKLGPWETSHTDSPSDWEIRNQQWIQSVADSIYLERGEEHLCRCGVHPECIQNHDLARMCWQENREANVALARGVPR